MRHKKTKNLNDENNRAVHDSPGHSVRQDGPSQDIPARKHAEKTLRHEPVLFERMFPQVGARVYGRNTAWITVSCAEERASS